MAQGYNTYGLTVGTPATMASTMKVVADTLTTGGSTPQEIAVTLGLLSQSANTATGITAHAGGGQTSATQLDYGVSNVTVVTTANDSVKLPAAVAGAWCFVMNSDASDSMQVFAGGTSTINGVAYGTGVAQAAGKAGLFYCVSGTGDDVAGAWVRLLGA